MKIAALLVTSFLTIHTTGCRRDCEVQPNSKSKSPYSKIVLPKDANGELKRLFEALKDYDYEIAVTIQPNYGRYKKVNNFIMGKSLENVRLEIDEDHYEPRSNGEWWYQDLDLVKYFGKRTMAKINDKEINFYVPKVIGAKKLGLPQSQDISRNGNILEWEKDPSSATGKIIFHYFLYDNEDKIISQNVLLIDDVGSYCIDELLADKGVNKIDFSLVSMNGALVTISHKKIFFHIGSIDMHEYFVKDIKEL